MERDAIRGMSNPVAGRLSATLTKLADMGEFLRRTIAGHERAFAVSVILFFICSAAIDVVTAPLWFDEFFTLFLSRVHSLGALLHAVPADGMPPLQYLLTGVSQRIFGETEFGVRVPELICYLAAGFLTYRIVRRHGEAVQALFALTLLMGSALVRSQASVARPYELLLAFSAFTFYSFQSAAGTDGDRLAALCGVALGLGGSILTHHFGIIQTGSFLLVGEAVRSFQRKRLDLWMLAAIGAGMSALAITLPLARQSTQVLGVAIRQSTIFWAQPKALDLLNYREMLPVELVLYVAVFGLLMQSGRREDVDEPAAHVPGHEWAAAITLCLILPVQIAIAFKITGYFQPKYAIGTCLGLALVGAWSAPRFLRVAQPVMALSTVVFLVLGAVDLVREQAKHPAWTSSPGAHAISPLLRIAPGDIPIVVANAFDYAPDWWYSPPEIQNRLVYLSDVSSAIKQPDFLPELTLIADKDYTPLPVETYSTFIVSHRHFVLLVSGRARLIWIDSRLSQAGWRMTPIGKSGGDTLYEVDGG